MQSNLRITATVLALLLAVAAHASPVPDEADPALAIANMKALTELAGQGKLKPRISHRFRLDQAAEALQVVIDRKVIGKAVLVS